MKKDNTPESVEVKADAKPSKKVKPVKPKKEKKQTSGAQLPFLLEFTYTMSVIVLIFLAFAVMITSIFAGASLYIVVLRTSVAMIVVGGLLMLIASQISSGLLFAAKIEQGKAEKTLGEPGDTSKHFEHVTRPAERGE